MSRSFDSVCTVLSGTCMPELLGLMFPNSVAKATANPIDASRRNSESGSRSAIRSVAEATSRTVTSTGLRRWARPERTAALPAPAVPAPLLDEDLGVVGSSVMRGGRVLCCERDLDDLGGAVTTHDAGRPVV